MSDWSREDLHKIQKLLAFQVHLSKHNRMYEAFFYYYFIAFASLIRVPFSSCVEKTVGQPAADGVICAASFALH